MLLGIDSNAHSQLYGPSSNERGDRFEEFVITNGLMVENVGNTPTFQAWRQNCLVATYIDVTLSRGLDGWITRWSVDQSFNGSDHNTITFDLELYPALEENKIRIWDLTDWLTFRSELKKNLLFYPKDLNEMKLEKMLQKFYKTVNMALDKASPKVVPNKKVRA